MLLKSRPFQHNPLPFKLSRKGDDYLAGPSGSQVLGGSWHLLANYNCTYNRTYNHIRTLKGRYISTVLIGL